MTLNLQGLRTVGCKVADLTAAKEWYTKVLGIEPYFDQPFYVGFNVAGYELGLEPEEGEGSPKGENTVTYWGVEDVNAAWDLLLASGATPLDNPMDVGDGIVVAAVKDPWGNAFGVICNPHFKL